VRATLDAVEGSMGGERVDVEPVLFEAIESVAEVREAFGDDGPPPGVEPPIQPLVGAGAQSRTVRVRRWQLAAVVGGAAVLGLVVGRAVTPSRTMSRSVSASGSQAPAPTSVGPETTLPQSQPAAGNPAPTSPAAAAAPVPQAPGPRLLLDLRRETGPKTTQHFVLTGGRWVLGWAYDCSGRGGQGAFQVTIYTPDGLPSTDGGVNQRGAKGSSIAAYTSTGERYLGVQTNCVWAIRVTTS
jgi:hypothetical protein